jgi:phytoene dehydrogenase-like protein
MPVDEYLDRFSTNKSLIDFIVQHFFKKAPVFFALSYFKVYTDYNYPMGGTGMLPEKIKEFLLDNDVEILLNTEITDIDPIGHHLSDVAGGSYTYRKLLWAADAKRLYDTVNIGLISDVKVRKRIENQKSAISGKRGGDSVFTLYLGVDLAVSYFRALCTGHFFYTPEKTGLSQVDSSAIEELLTEYDGTASMDRERAKGIIINWLEQYFKLTTYEIAIPALRDESLTPKGKTGLIVSTLFDFPLVKLASDLGWYE